MSAGCDIPQAIVDARVNRAPWARFERCESCRTLVASSTATDTATATGWPSLIERWRRPLAWEDDGALRSARVHTTDRCRQARGGAR